MKRTGVEISTRFCDGAVDVEVVEIAGGRRRRNDGLVVAYVLVVRLTEKLRSPEEHQK